MSRGCTNTGVALVIAVLNFACGKSAPAPPSIGSPPGPVTIRGTEQLAWDQPAADTQELATIGYAFYIDGTSRVVVSATCANTPGAAGYECRTLVPHMNAGTHTLEVASFYLTSPSQESGRSNQLQVTLNSVTAITAGPGLAARAESTSSAQRNRSPGRLASAESGDDESANWPTNAIRVVNAVDNPSDLAFTPDGRLWVAERAGSVRVIRDAMLVPQPALSIESGAERDVTLLALAPDPQFSRNHFLYAIYSSRSRSGALHFSIARFREASDTLADRVVILDNVAASADPHAALRFGPDGKLYAAFDDGGDERLAGDAASFNGKILRLNPDGTTPDDSPRKSPVLAIGGSSPRGLAWNRATGRLWEADRSRVGAVLWTPEPIGLDAAENDLLIASGAGLVRAAIDRTNPGRFAATAEVFGDLGVRAVTVSPDGRVFFATTDAIGVVAP